MGVGILDVFEHFRGKAGESAEVQQFTFSQRITDFENSVVRQSYNVARIGFIHGAFPLGHELHGRTETYGFVESYMLVGGVALEFSAAYFAERDTRSVVGVDIGRDFEDESCEFFFFGRNGAFFSLSGAWAGSDAHETVEQFFHTEVVQG